MEQQLAYPTQIKYEASRAKGKTRHFSIFELGGRGVGSEEVLSKRNSSLLTWEDGMKRCACIETGFYQFEII